MDPDKNFRITRTIAAAAESLGISRREIYRLISIGTLRKVKVGRRSLIPEADLRALADGSVIPRAYADTSRMPRSMFPRVFADGSVMPVCGEANPFDNLERQP